MSSPRKKRRNTNFCYVCEWQGCTNTVFEDLLSYSQHVRRHSWDAIKGLDSSAPVISYCGWTGCFEDSFMSTRSYLLHLSFHAYHCKLMSRGDEALSGLKSTVKTSSTPIECNRDPSDRCVLPELPDEFICSWQNCLTSFDDAEGFYRHVDTHAMDIAIPSLSKEVLKTTRFATCLWLVPSDSGTDYKACGQSFLSKSHLKNHLRSHSQEKTVACSTCGAMFSDKSKFYDHVLRQVVAESSDLTHLCTMCDAKFLTQRLLNEHTKKHTNGIICAECGKLSYSTSEHNKHYSFKHSDVKPFDCKFCDSRFKLKVDLRRHIYTHNNDNSFKCPIENCSYECRCQQSLTRHQKKVHQNQPLSVFECHECRARFSRGSNLTKHLMNEHSIEKPPSDSRFRYIPDAVTGIFHLSSLHLPPPRPPPSSASSTRK